MQSVSKCDILIMYQRGKQRKARVANMSIVANEGTRFTIVSNNGTFKVVREYMGDFTDEFIGMFDDCVAYCENKVLEINEAVIF